MRGIINIIIGGIMVAGGLSGKLVLLETESGIALAVVGGILVLLGLRRMISSRGE